MQSCKEFLLVLASHCNLNNVKNGLIKLKLNYRESQLNNRQNLFKKKKQSGSECTYTQNVGEGMHLEPQWLEVNVVSTNDIVCDDCKCSPAHRDRKSRRTG